MKRKNSPVAVADDFLVRRNSFSKKFLLFAVYGAMITAGGILPEIYAADILEGIPQRISGATVYTANVEPGQQYTNVFGVRSDSTNSENYGAVNINEGTVTNSVYGCRAISDADLTSASCNKVKITNSTVGTVYGGYAYGGSNSASVHSNTVNIDGGSITGYVYGGNSDGTTISVAGNNVNIKNAQIAKTVYGGCAFNNASWLSMLRNNVVIENSTVNGSVYGGYASGSATASNSNTVTIRGNSVINGSVYGGYALSSNSDAKNNTVIIEGGTMNLLAPRGEVSRV